MKTKNYEQYFKFYYCPWNWALLLNINVQWLTKKYINISLHVLCFYFDFVRISHKYSAKLDNIKGL